VVMLGFREKGQPVEGWSREEVFRCCKRGGKW
jgi:hypothetical protein